MAIQQEFVALNSSDHDVKAFDCGKPDMNQYLARFAAKNMALKLSMTWALPGDETVVGRKTPIAAYYTLVSALRQSVTLTERGLPAMGLILDVLDEDALACYERFDLFKPCTEDPMRLFVPMAIIQQI